MALLLASGVLDRPCALAGVQVRLGGPGQSVFPDSRDDCCGVLTSASRCDVHRCPPSSG